MKKIILIICAMVAFASCNQTPSLPIKEAYATEYETSYAKSIADMEADTNYIAFYFDNVYAYIYNPKDGVYVIDYYDPDLSLGPTEFDGAFISVPNSISKELWVDSSKSIVERAYMENDCKWLIQEIIVPSGDSLTWYYNLVKNDYYE